MPHFVQSTNINTTANGTPAFTLAASDTLFVTETATLTTTGTSSAAIQAATSNRVTLAGVLYSAASNAVAATDFLELRIAETGSIFSNFAAISTTGGSNTIVNYGEVLADGQGVLCFGGGNSLTNFGTIASSALGVDFESGGNYIVNHGSISGTGSGADGIFIAAGDNRIINHGVISGHNDEGIQINSFGGDTFNEIYNYGTIERVGFVGTYAVSCTGTAATTLINEGTIVGGVVTGDGNDTIDTSLGGITGSISSGAGDDTIIGGVRGERMQGGAGEDTLVGNDGNDVLIGGAGADELDGGDGFDTASYADAGSGVTADLAAADANNSGSAAGDRYVSIEWLTGSGFNDVLRGDNLANRLQGGAGADSLDGRNGDDRLDGGLGDDSMTGGGGNDLFIVDSSGDVLFELVGGGTDTVRTSASLTLAAGQEVERVVATGTGSINLNGNEFNNLLVGNEGQNTLNGGTGKDTLRGGAGDDTYVIDSTDDTIVEHVGEGIDTITTLVSRTLGANQENMTLLGTAAINGSGNTLSNTMVGNSGANQIDGREGADSLTGNAGNDKFVFRAGMGNGDTVTDFSGNGASAGDSFLFLGYGPGATFVQINATQWQISSADASIVEVINLSNGATVDSTDIVFG